MQAAKAWEIATKPGPVPLARTRHHGGVTEGAIDRARLLYEWGRARPLTCRCFQMGRGPFRFSSKSKRGLPWIGEPSREPARSAHAGQACG